MKFSLSGRIIEVAYKYCKMSIDEFIKMAGEIGYDAVELRRTQISEKSTPEELQQIKEASQKYNVGISRIPACSVKDDASMKELEKYADMAVELNCPYLAIGFETTQWAQKAADYLKERDLSIAIQVHTDGPFESPELALKTLKEIDRDNFGLMYDPANYFVRRIDYVKAVEQLKDYIFIVSVQCLAEASPDDPNAEEERGFYYKRHLLGQPGGMDFQAVFDAVKKIGFDGYVTVIEPISELMESRELAKHMYEQLKKMTA